MSGGCIRPCGVLDEGVPVKVLVIDGELSAVVDVAVDVDVVDVVVLLVVLVVVVNDDGDDDDNAFVTFSSAVVGKDVVAAVEIEASVSFIGVVVDDAAVLVVAVKAPFKGPILK